jgi:uncharacterized membrane protein YhdT
MTDEFQPTNSPTLRAHKRQFVWQILLPILLVVLLILTAGVFVTKAGSSDARLWADVSTIWIIAPLLILALGCATALGFVIYGLAKLLQIAPRYTNKAQQYAALGSAGVHRIADGIVQPILWLGQIGGVFKNFFKPPVDKKEKG